MNITYENTITADEVNAVRKSMGWRQWHPEQMQEIIDNAEFIIAAYDDKAVGVAMSDGTMLIIPESLNINIKVLKMNSSLVFLILSAAN